VAGLYHGQGKGLHLTFDFDLMESVVAGLLAEDLSDVERTLCSFGRHFPAGTGDATFLANHDLIRLATRLAEKPELLRLGAELLFTLPGTPFIYYGQEIGLRNGPTPDDKHKRLPMPWSDEPGAGFTTGTPWKAPHGEFVSRNVAVQSQDPESLLSLYRRLVRLRRAQPTLSVGSFFPVSAVSKTNYDVWAFGRRWDGDTALCVVNPTASDALATTVETGMAALSQATRLWPDEAPATMGPGGTLQVGDLAAHSLSVFLVR